MYVTCPFILPSSRVFAYIVHVTHAFMLHTRSGILRAFFILLVIVVVVFDVGRNASHADGLCCLRVIIKNPRAPFLASDETCCVKNVFILFFSL